MKRLTLIFDCGCSVTLWAERDELKEAGHKCLEHESDDPGCQSLERKKICQISVEPAPR